MEQMKTLTVNGEPYEVVDEEARAMAEALTDDIKPTVTDTNTKMNGSVVPQLMEIVDYLRRLEQGDESVTNDDGSTSWPTNAGCRLANIDNKVDVLRNLFLDNQGQINYDNDFGQAALDIVLLSGESVMWDVFHSIFDYGDGMGEVSTVYEKPSRIHRIERTLGDVSAALDSILIIQNTLMGGESA